MTWRLNYPNRHSFLFPPDTLDNLRRIAELNDEGIEQLLLSGVVQVVQERRAAIETWKKEDPTHAVTGAVDAFKYPGHEIAPDCMQKPEPDWLTQDMTLGEYDEASAAAARANLAQTIVTLDVPEDVMTSVRDVNAGIWEVVGAAAHRVILNEFEIEAVDSPSEEI